MKRNTRRSLGLTSLLIAVAVCLGWWPQPSAAVRAVVKLADENPSWSKGRFFRTGLAASNIGGIQLIPIKLQQTWGNAADLPQPLSSHTSTTYGSHMFVVGGNTLGNNNTLVKSNAFFATRLNDERTGQLRPWATMPPLPIAVSEPASVVVEVGGQPYLFVLGGQKASGSNLEDVTTSSIFYYPIREDNNGNLAVASWQQVPDAQKLPHETFLAESGSIRGGGARGLAAVSVNVGNTPYIYVFGGFNRVFNNNAYIDRYHSTVYRVPVTSSGGTVSLGTWDWLNDSQKILNSTGTEVFLAGAAAVTFSNPLDNSTGVYLIGGIRCTASCSDKPTIEQESNAYVGRIAADGSLTWLEQGNMSAARSDHDAVQSKGQIVVAAGRSNDVPTTSLAQGFVEDDLTLYRATPSSPNFDLLQGALNAQARMNHSMEAVSAGQYGDWGYIIGGKVEVSQGVVSNASAQVLLGNLDVPPTQSDAFVSDGKYYSKVFDFGEDAEYFSLRWNALLDAGEQIQIQYRTGASAQSLGALSAPIQSVNGLKEHPLPTGLKARYFQFVATLTRSNTTTTSSPVLDSVWLDVNRVGFPNIRVDSNAGASITPNPIAPDSTIAPSVTITNEAFDAQTPAIPADWDGGGSFFVDLYVTPPGQTPRAPTLGEVGVAYAEVSKAGMQVGAKYAIQGWRPSSCFDPNNPPPSGCTVNWHNIFNTKGTYNVYIMVDSMSGPSDFGNVKEADFINTIGETDNVYGPFTVEVSESRGGIFLPLVMRSGATATSTASAPATPSLRVHTLGDSR